MFSRDSVVAERNWAVLVGVTTSGSHASTHWFKASMKRARSAT